jgi:CheY-like chemotaxis protein
MGYMVNILSLGDDGASQSRLAADFQSAGHEVTLVTTAEAALEALLVAHQQEKPFDLVVAATHYPGQTLTLLGYMQQFCIPTDVLIPTNDPALIVEKAKANGCLLNGTIKPIPNYPKGVFPTHAMYLPASNFC